MNVRRQNQDEQEKLNNDEIKEMMESLDFERNPSNVKSKNHQTINNFFTDKKGNRYVPPAKNEARGKKY